jgi:integrase/recombinase XerD
VTDDALAGALEEHDTYLTVERGLAANSLAGYRRDLARYATYLRAHDITNATEVDEATVAKYIDGLRSARDDEGKPKYAPASIARAVVAIKSLHRFLVDEEIVDADPTEELGAPRVPQSIPKALTEAEVNALLDAVVGDDARAWRDRSILETLYASGVRISELVGVDLPALDVDDGVMRVFGKGSKERMVPIGRSARDALSEYLRVGRPTLVSKATRSRANYDAVFLNARGGRLTRQGCWKLVAAYGEKVGLRGRLSPHVLRHSCATHMVDHGADIRVVQELLGHASISTTQIYTKVSAARLRAVYETAHPRAKIRPLARSGR